MPSSTRPTSADNGGGGWTAPFIAPEARLFSMSARKKIVAEHGHLPPGEEAVSTTGGRLPGPRSVIHTVGPIWRGCNGEPGAAFANAYRNSLRLADRLGLASSVAFPRFPPALTAIRPRHSCFAIESVVDRRWPRRGTTRREVRFVLFDSATFTSAPPCRRSLATNSH